MNVDDNDANVVVVVVVVVVVLLLLLPFLVPVLFLLLLFKNFFLLSLTCASTPTRTRGRTLGELGVDGQQRHAAHGLDALLLVELRVIGLGWGLGEEE